MPRRQPFGAAEFVGISHIDENRQVEVAVANMPNDWGNEPARRHVRLGRYDAFGKVRNRHADIACNRFGAGP